MNGPEVLETPRLSVEEKALFSWRNDPVLYFDERLGIPPDALSEDEKTLLRALPRAIRERRPVVVPSGHSLGKDYTISGRATLWFYECFGPCKVIGTGPTERQVLDIMFAELKNAYANKIGKDIIGRLISGKLEASENHFISVFTTKEGADQTGKFQGAHSERMMIVVTEAQAVDDRIFEQIDGITTSGLVLSVYLGNPLHNTGRFAQMIDDTTRNIVIRMDCLNSPNYIAKKQILPGVCSYEWVEDKRARWNADGMEKDPRWLARVRGIKPDSSIWNVISQKLYDSCIDRACAWWSDQRGTIGVDPALGGADDMVVSVMKSGKLVRELVIAKCDAPEACSHIAVMQKEEFPDGGCVVVVDCDGLGAPIAQFYRKMLPQTRLPINLVEFHGSCSDHNIVDPMYQNHRAECAHYAKERMAAGHICLDTNEQARQEAIIEEYFINTRGKIQLEDKSDIKDRIGRSPGRWDARKLAIWGFKFAEPIKKTDKWRDGSGSSMIPAAGSFMGA